MNMISKIWQPSLFTVMACLNLLSVNPAQSQIIPDHTLGNENSRFTPTGVKELIEGGAIRGSNLFHSFSEFNVLNNQQVYFANPTGINNILTRVTGNNQSHILGTLGVSGNANLFLINPNGIMFGKDAKLDIKGSFFASTTNAIKFADGNIFAAKNQTETPLLTMSVPVGVQWGNNNQTGNINNAGNLTVGNGQNLTLLGNHVTNTGNLTAPGGKIAILGNNINVLNSSKIDVSAFNKGGVILIGGDEQGKGNINAQNIKIDNGVNLKADALINGDGGKVIVWADKETKFYGKITANGGKISGNGGFVEVSGKENLIFRGDVKTTAFNGLNGRLLLDPTNIIIASGSGGNITDANDNITIYQSTLEGLSGNTNIELQATNDITINALNNQTLNLANGNGTITFTADSDINGMGNFTMNTTDTIKTNGRDINISGAKLTLGNIDTTSNRQGDIINITNIDAGGIISEGQASFTFTVNDLAEPVSNLEVRFSASHTWDGDLTVVLAAPSGAIGQLLFDKVGGGGDNFQDTLLKDGATTYINDASAPFNGTFKTAGPGGLAIFNNQNAVGTWTLTVMDNTSENSGTLYKAGDTAPWGTAIGTQLIFRNSTNAIIKNGKIVLNASNGSINTGDLTSGSVGNSESITLNARNNITTGILNSSSVGGVSGAINISSNNGNITTKSLNSFSYSPDGNIGESGTINISTNNGNITTKDVYSILYSLRVDGNSGAINLHTGNGNITTGILNSISFSGSGGAINLSTNNGNITTQNIDSWSLFSFDGNGGRGGAINLSTNNGNITTKSLRSVSYSFDNSGRGAATVIKANGNSEIQSYEGGSLHIWTTGKVNILESVSIVSGDSVNGLIQTVALPDGTSILIDGQNKSTLDIRSNANISIGGDINNSGGLVFLTNNYNPNTSLTEANISVGNIITSKQSGNGGNVYIDSTGNITANKITTVTSFSTNTSGGDIKLFAGKTVLINGGESYDFREQFGLSSGADDVINGNGGNIFVKATKDIIINPTNMDLTSAAINASAITRNGGDIGNSGNIQLTSLEGNIIVNQGIFTNSTTAYGLFSGNSGDIKINAINGIINVKPNGAGAIVTRTRTDIHTNNSQTGNAGKIELNGREINITGRISDVTQDLDISTQSSETGIGGDIIFNSQTPLNLVNLTMGTDARNGSGGKVQINAPGVNLDHTSINTTTIGTGKAGNIEITANNNSVLLQNNSTIKASSQADATGDGGTIIINSKDFILQSNSFVQAITDGVAKGGNIFVNRDINPANSVILTNNSSLSVAATNNNKNGQAGIININTKSLNLTGNSATDTAKILASTTKGEGLGIVLTNLESLNITNGLISASTIDGKAGSLKINQGQIPVGNINLNQGKLSVKATGIGDSGTIDINVKNLNLNNNSEISASTKSGTGQNINGQNLSTLNINSSIISTSTNTGKAGSININNKQIPVNSVQLNNGIMEAEAISNNGEAGSLIINAKELRLDNNSQITAANYSGQNGGNIQLENVEILDINNSQISASTKTGNGGNINLNVNNNSTKSVNIKGANSSINVRANNQGGNAGIINLNTRKLTMIDNAEISASNISGNSQDILLENLNILEVNHSKITATTVDGQAGNLKITATDSVNINNNSELSTATFGSGNAGGIIINTNKFNASGGGKLITKTTGSGEAGNMTINAEKIFSLDGENTGLFANTTINSTGKGGNITVDPDLITITNGAEIAVNSQGTGSGGNIFLQGKVLILNNGLINAETASNKGGEITLNIGQYLLFNNHSQITATAGTSQSGGDGGNIQINVPFIIGFATNPNHQIIANAFTGKGGNIDITTNAIFQIQYIDIQASSQFGVNGSVNISTPGVDPATGLTNLPSVPTDLSKLIERSCKGYQRRSLKVSGKNGIPLSPYYRLTPNHVFSDWGLLPINIGEIYLATSENTFDKEKYNLIQIQGLITDKKEKMILGSPSEKIIFANLYLQPFSCSK